MPFVDSIRRSGGSPLFENWYTFGSGGGFSVIWYSHFLGGGGGGEVGRASIFRFGGGGVPLFEFVTKLGGPFLEYRQTCGSFALPVG